MKIAVPRLGISIGLGWLAGAGAAAVMAFNEFKVDPKSGNAVLEVFAAIFLGSGGVGLIFDALISGYAFRVWGESRSFALELAEGEGFQIGPFWGVAGKAVCLEITNDLPGEYKDKVHSFFVYRSLPPAPVVRYEVKLICCDDEGSHVVAKDEFKVRVYSFHSERSDEGAAPDWEKAVQSLGERFYLQIRVLAIVLNESEKIRKRAGMKARIKGNLSVAVKIDDLLRLGGISLRQSSVTEALSGESCAP